MRLIVILGFAFLFYSCQEEVALELENRDKIPVIEGVWTDNPSENFVSVAYSRDYYDTLDNELIPDALVQIEDLNNGGIVEFRYVGELGHYLPLNQQAAEIGHEYRLRVALEGNEYSATGTTLEAPVLDSITYEFKEERFFADEGYYLTLYGKIPFNENNFYRLKLTRNDTLLNRRSDYFLFDDTFGSSILNNGFELTGFTFEKEDKVKLQMLRLNEGAYDYLNQLVNLLFNDGGLFSPPPANPETNIRVSQGSGEVMGYFMTAPVVTRTIVIREEDAN
ncbi:DUF4249 domain-containing protein [Cyclobacterium jeungdonense]|uniref:DUF4249 domain-containing protein n=1 Tax=Cyclobacterium jeungdonense TaxID=708087 RepID=A0ABT8C6U0_9BACT|nr:DUF4249 domain-containing protein [Cyclobacterium jeungdonense]MDN3688474.1 DUF4249 domain-containing protein [Cyclobacterium jeungdonense]